MLRTMTIKPAEGLQVRDPATKERIPAEGATVPRNSYWLRRLEDGDVIEVPAQDDQAAAQPKKAGKASGGEQA